MPIESRLWRGFCISFLLFGAGACGSILIAAVVYFLPPQTGTQPLDFATMVKMAEMLFCLSLLTLGLAGVTERGISRKRKYVYAGVAIVGSLLLVAWNIVSLM